MVVHRLGQQVSDVLFTASAVDGPDVLLGEHGAFLVRLLVLHGEEHVVEALDLRWQGNARKHTKQSRHQN